MRLILLVLACCYSILLTAQQPKASATTSSKSINPIIDKLTRGLKADPNNPIQVNPDQLLKMAEALPEGNLKNKMLEYSTQLNNPELSFRQLYWDMAQAFDVMPEAIKLQQFGDTYQSVDVLLNKSKMVINAFKGDLKGINATTFMNDPQFNNALTKLTGSSSLAQNIGLGLGIGIELINAFKADRERKRQFIADYKKFADLSTSMVFAEQDEYLSKALIDAAVLKINTPVNVLFKYEHPDGSMVYVEDGLLKWKDASGKTKKNLSVAARRNDGVLDFDYNQRHFKNTGLAIVSGDQLTVSAYTYDKRDCSDCLVDTKSKSYLGMAKITTSDVMTFSMKDLKPVATTTVPLKGKAQKKYLDSIMKAAEEYKIQMSPAASFTVNGKQTPFSKTMQGSVPTYLMPSGGDIEPQLFWHVEEKHTGNLLYMRNKTTKATSSRFLQNNIAAIYTVWGKTAYLVGSSGGIAVIDIRSGDPESLAKSIEDQLAKPGGLPKYQFRIPEQDEAIYGGVGQEGRAEYVGMLPSLKLAPGGNYLFYFVDNTFSIIDAHDVTKSRTFSLNSRPADVFFGRENNDTTILISSFNEFTFPVVKKYSMSKLIGFLNEKETVMTEPVEPESRPASKESSKSPVKGAKPAAKDAKKPASTPKSNTDQGKKETAGSLSEEIRNLKKLLDEGIITKEEFEAAKKKLLKN